jgi:hypothetical protein
MNTSKDFSHIKVELDLDGVVHKGALQDDLPINESNITAEFIVQPELFAWWATVMELAKDLVAREKYRLDRLYAITDHNVRKFYNDNKQKVTEKIVENEVITDEEYQKAKLEYLEAKKQLGLLLAGKEAMVQRKDMLISIGANMRAQDGVSNPGILKGAARDTARRAASKAAADAAYDYDSEPYIKAWCAECGGQQKESPSGRLCDKGHGGVASLNAPPSNKKKSPGKKPPGKKPPGKK